MYTFINWVTLSGIHTHLYRKKVYSFVKAPCPEDMTPSSDFPVKTSSGDDTKDGLTDDGEEPWKPDDEKPRVTVTVTEEDENVPITKVTVSDEKTKNVEEVKVVVKDKDNKKVVRQHLLFFLSFNHVNLVVTNQFLK